MDELNLNRRQFLLGSVSLLALSAVGAGVYVKSAAAPVSGSIIGASHKLGHRLRSPQFPLPSSERRTGVVIVGGGIAGLSAAWKLKRSGFNDFLLLEMEAHTGGNSSSGSNAVSAYPWGAHYVPLLTQEANSARALFEELGIITGYQNGTPEYNEYYLCADPHERLYRFGRWQDGLVPQIGLTEDDQRQYREFFAQMEAYKQMMGNDGKRAFAIPLDKSSADETLRKLDAISMADYLREHGWNSEPLLWYIDYCCRDDFGAKLEHVSAWAGIHYFASRNGKAANNGDPQSVITWPEGNGFLADRLREAVRDHIITNALTYKLTEQDGHVTLNYLNATDETTASINASAVILATPRFVAERLLVGGTASKELEYSPWVVANITLDTMPKGTGAPLSWDNMIYGSKLLGYITATHQHLDRNPRNTVLTYYWPLTHTTPKSAREEAIARTYEEWRDIFLHELFAVHPELKGHVKQLDICLWGHGMIRPYPGFIWGATRQAMAQPSPRIFHAHSDMSGISIFEEANYQGVKAAEALMSSLKHSFTSSL